MLEKKGVLQSALSHELHLKGISHVKQHPIPVKYKNIEVRSPFFIDIMVEDKVIIEVKATAQDYPFYHAQLMTHLKLACVKVGLLINFGKKDLREGLHYMVNS